jgi:glycosyltransferase involved in cell wall biosynthesis
MPSLEAKTYVVHNGVDANVFHPQRDGSRVRREFGVNSGEVLVGMVGRVSARKGQRYFLEVASQVARHCPRARFALVGGTLPGDESGTHQLKRWARALGLASRVIISEWRRDIPDVWAAFDIAVLPSVMPESFGLSALEAMATGKPVVATGHGGLLEVVCDARTGILVPPGDVSAMADALESLIRSRGMRRAMGAAGRRRVEECFTVERVAGELQRRYEQARIHR